MGDAGALVTCNAHLARRAACFARHGGLVKGSHEIEGINSRLDGLQAAILNVKLPHLADWTKKRQAVKGHLAENGIQTVINYPVALPFLEAYAHQGNNVEDFPKSYAHQGEILPLPVFPDMTSEMVQYVADKILVFSK